MKAYDKQDFPVGEIRRFLEPGPIVLVSSAWRGKRNIMTMGWHMVMEFSPSLIGCYIWNANQSFEMVRGSQECVINIPTVDLAPKVVAIGNSSGRGIDKFARFQLTAAPATKVKAPLIADCYANYECKLVDSSLIREVQPVRARSREGARGDIAQIPAHDPLPRRRCVHDFRHEHEQVSQILQEPASWKHRFLIVPDRMTASDE